MYICAEVEVLSLSFPGWWCFRQGRLWSLTALSSCFYKRASLQEWQEMQALWEPRTQHCRGVGDKGSKIKANLTTLACVEVAASWICLCFWIFFCVGSVTTLGCAWNHEMSFVDHLLVQNNYLVSSWPHIQTLDQLQGNPALIQGLQIPFPLVYKRKTKLIHEWQHSLKIHIRGPQIFLEQINFQIIHGMKQNSNWQPVYCEWSAGVPQEFVPLGHVSFWPAARRKKTVKVFLVNIQWVENHWVDQYNQVSCFIVLFTIHTPSRLLLWDKQAAIVYLLGPWSPFSQGSPAHMGKGGVSIVSYDTFRIWISQIEMLNKDLETASQGNQSWHPSFMAV